MLAFTPTGIAASEAVTFDPQVLKDRGIDPALADYFREAPRFAQGTRSASLQVNGQPKGRVQMTFNKRGDVCLDPDLLKAAGVRALVLPAREAGTCVTFAEGFTEAVVQLHPGREQVDLLIPTEALLPPDKVSRNFAKGGMAGVFNYDALMVNSELQGQRSDYRSVTSELGFNVADWVFRSRQSYTVLSDDTRFEHLYAYGMRTLEDYEVNLQVGQLNMVSPLFVGESFIGVQVQPEGAFHQLRAAERGAGSRVEGVAYSAARIEVRQSGVMIYSTMVPSGPFTLRELPLLSRSLDLDVTVHEQDGQQRRFRVPAASLYDAEFGSPPGFNAALGRVRRLGADERKAPSFAAFSKDWNWGRDRRVTGGLLGGTEYVSAGWGLQQQWPGGIALGVRQVLSSDQSQGLAGHQIQMTFSAMLSPSLSTSLVNVRQSEGFRTLSDTGWDHERRQAESRSRDQWVFSLNGATEHWGTFGATWSRYSSLDAPPQSRLGLSWSQTLAERVSLSVSLERDMGGAATSRQGNAAYLTLGIPLGGQRSVRSYVRKDDRAGVRSGVVLSDALNETLDYSVSAEQRDDGPTTVGARVSSLARYTSIDLGYSQRPDATDFDLGARGGMVFHKDGVTLSPYPVRDTFGVLKAGEQSGLKLQTPRGPVWTDGFGRAVAASLPAYTQARLEVDNAGLPRNVEVLNGFQEVEAGRGSVQHLDFSVMSVRRLLLKARTGDRQWLPKGAAVHDEQGQYVTTVLDTGTIFLPDAKPDQQLHVRLSGTERCVLEYPLTDAPRDSTRIETVDATCLDPNLS
ncbi:fimbria/pilus outer membrane usher protein [Pseudomonas sp. dw_612]|uniref:fimbria/pilus outer membrane usher protein n=1 Tax=Pseudomonas sp. dw_612 TaxID=2720080 RepID=UPI003207B37B